MAGSPDGNIMTPAAAKSRLLELGRSRSAAAQILGGPVARAALLISVGAVIGTMLRRRGGKGVAAALGNLVIRTGAAAAPLLVHQLVRGVAKHAANRASSPRRSIDELPQ